jgi:hypothetical protein
MKGFLLYLVQRLCYWNLAYSMLTFCHHLQLIQPTLRTITVVKLDNKNAFTHGSLSTRNNINVVGDVIGLQGYVRRRLFVHTWTKFREVCCGCYAI